MAIVKIGNNPKGSGRNVVKYAHIGARPAHSDDSYTLDSINSKIIHLLTTGRKFKTDLFKIFYKELAKIFGISLESQRGKSKMNTFRKELLQGLATEDPKTSSLLKSIYLSALEIKKKQDEEQLNQLSKTETSKMSKRHKTDKIKK